ncbi:MAG: hypothetical protein LBO05_07460, partial [Deltaproteobacteria bacterium]|jgi:hypothetical protein|nr:hypothetical protein [Deltaproteobacteria bacterium]
MDPVLKESREADPGFAQFVDRHGIVASTPEMLKAYDDWQTARMAWGEEIAWVEAKGKAEGIAKGKAEGIAEGIAENQLNIALVLFRAVKSGDNSRDAVKTARYYGIPKDIIRAAKGRAEAGRV